MSTPPLLVFGYGNPSCGDDALGSLLLKAVADEPGCGSDFELLSDFQLQIEHALDMVGRERVLFVDATHSNTHPFTIQQLTATRGSSYTTHELHPAALLQIYSDIHNSPPPLAYLLSIGGEQFGLGDLLSQTATRNLEAATKVVRQVITQPQLLDRDITAAA